MRNAQFQTRTVESGYGSWAPLAASVPLRTPACRHWHATGKRSAFVVSSSPVRTTCTNEQEVCTLQGRASCSMKAISGHAVNVAAAAPAAAALLLLLRLLCDHHKSHAAGGCVHTSALPSDHRLMQAQLQPLLAGS